MYLFLLKVCWEFLSHFSSYTAATHWQQSNLCPHKQLRIAQLNSMCSSWLCDPIRATCNPCRADNARIVGRYLIFQTRQCGTAWLFINTVAERELLGPLWLIISRSEWPQNTSRQSRKILTIRLASGVSHAWNTRCGVKKLRMWAIYTLYMNETICGFSFGLGIGEYSITIYCEVCGWSGISSIECTSNTAILNSRVIEVEFRFWNALKI